MRDCLLCWHNGVGLGAVATGLLRLQLDQIELGERVVLSLAIEHVKRGRLARPYLTSLPGGRLDH